MAHWAMGARTHEYVAVAPRFDDFHGQSAAVLELGCLFGALGAGVLADRVSRRSSIAFACGVCGPYAMCSTPLCFGADWLLPMKPYSA